MYPTVSYVDILLILVILFYGIRILIHPPKYLDRGSMRTRLTRSSPETWRFGRRTAAILLLADASLLTAMDTALLLVFGKTCLAFFQRLHILVQAMTVLAIVFLMDHKNKKRFSVPTR